MGANTILFDRGLRHATFLERLKAQEAKQILQLLKMHVIPDLEKEIIHSLAKGLTPTRQRQLLSTMRGIIKGGMSVVHEKTASQLTRIAKLEAEFQTSSLRATLRPLGISTTFTVPSETLLRAIVTSNPFQGELLKPWFDVLGKNLQTRISRQLSIGLVEGQSIPTMTRRIRSVLSLSKHEATSLVRTATTHVTARARELTFQENSDVVEAVKYVATLDGKTTLICGNLDGQIFPIGEGPRPSMHFRCRSTTVPVVKGWKELGLKDPPASTRAALGGPEKTTTTFPKWLERQPRSIQNQVLGPKRAELWRNGDVQFDKFVGADFRPLTLEQLAVREGIKIPA